MKIIGKLGIGLAAGGAHHRGRGDGVRRRLRGPATGTPTGARATFVCAHLDEIKASSRPASTCSTAGCTCCRRPTTRRRRPARTRRVERIEARIATMNERITKVTDRQTKLTDWAAAHCTAAPTPG